MIRKIAMFIFIMLMLACSKDKLIIDDDNSSSSYTVAKNEVISSDRKPLTVISSTDTILIFVRQDGAPGMYLGDDGDVHGFYVDLETLIMNHMNQSYKFVPYSDVGPVIQGLKTGTHHIGLSVPDLPDYREIFNLSVPYEILHFITFVSEGNTDILGSTKDETIKSLYGKKVGVQTQGHIYQVLRDIKEINLIQYPTTTKALEDLNNGLLDAVPDVKRIGIYYSKINNWKIKFVGKPIISQNITTGFSKILDKSLLDRYNTSLKALISDGSVKKLWESYYGPMGADDIP
ncbi:MAG: transporter substrate-binding domain-containing protein [Spirochaetaceae bacterium]